jgi:hypothetical protein
VAVRATANQLHHAELPRRSGRTLAAPLGCESFEVHSLERAERVDLDSTV